ncbi:MAG: ACT domain-containing protein [Oscillospiraceae bacterium]|nr:ACT domain-containing protein [Oscillospiraceae bacterium]MDD3833453.1 ACT domain-containing protein [Oscillospiraceae bacterium]MDD4546711.1 ACT domain-containing protein [Oscillospiraceae bacterium]
MLIKQLSIFVENKSGRLAEITAVIAQAGIDIRALSIADTTNFGILRIIVDKPDEAEKALKDAGLTVSLTNVIAIGIPDKPGGFASAMKCLADAGVGIEYMYAFISRDQGRACVILRVGDNDLAIDALKKADVEILTGERIYTM